MSGRETGGRAESIRQRLRNELRARGEDVTLGLPRYAVERFLYRLGRSRHRERFVLKGATLFAIWGTAYRPTRDIDFTGYGSPAPQDVIGAFREICDTPDEVDPLVFDTATHHGGADPGWLRVRRASHQDQGPPRGIGHPHPGGCRLRQCDRSRPGGEGVSNDPGRSPAADPGLPTRVRRGREAARDGHARRAQQPLQGFLRPLRDGGSVPVRAEHSGPGREGDLRPPGYPGGDGASRGARRAVLLGPVTRCAVAGLRRPQRLDRCSRRLRPGRRAPRRLSATRLGRPLAPKARWPVDWPSGGPWR